MIRPLRDLHRRAFGFLLLILPVLLAAAVSLRDPLLEPQATVPSDELVRTYPQLVPRYGVSAELRRDAQTSLLFFTSGEIPEPDVLVYVSAPHEPLASAQFAGRFRRGSGIRLPRLLPHTKVIFYTGARQEVLAEAVIETDP